MFSFVLIYSSSFAGKPPVAVKKAFMEKFPTASKVVWGKEAVKEWEADFMFEGKKISANFAQDGTWLETEKMIKASELPAAVSEAIKSKFAGWKIMEADKTETSKHGIIYEADLQIGAKKKSVAYKEDGTFVVE